MGNVRRCLDGLYKTSGVIAALFLAAICVLVVIQVILNAIDRVSTLTTGAAIGLTIPSYSDFTGFFLTAASFFALAYTLREGGHIRVVLVIQRLGPGARRLVELWCLGLAAVMTAYFAWFAANLVLESYTYNDLSPGMVPVPIWIPQIPIALGLVVLMIALADDFLMTLRGRDPSYLHKQENLLAGAVPEAVMPDAGAPREAQQRRRKPNS